MADTALYPKKLIERGKWNDYRMGIWGNSYTWSWIRPWSQLKYLVIHHTVTSHDATPDDIALLHRARGWSGIGYHLVITKDGTVHYVGDVATARANVLNKNEQVIGITIVGDFTKHLPSDEQIKSAHDLCKYFLTEVPSIPTLNSWDQVVGHKDLQATQCPGTSWPDDMRQRIIDRRVYSTQLDLEPTSVPTSELEHPCCDKYGDVLVAVELPREPQDVPSERVTKAIAGYKGSVTAAQKQLESRDVKIASLEQEVENRKDQLANNARKCQDDKTLSEKRITTLKSGSKAVEALEEQYETILQEKQTRLDEANKQKGIAQKSLKACEAGRPKSTFFSWLKSVFNR